MERASELQLANRLITPDGFDLGIQELNTNELQPFVWTIDNTTYDASSTLTIDTYVLELQ